MMIAKIQYEIFCDIDGVLSDFTAGAAARFPTYTQDLYNTDAKFRTMLWTTLRQDVVDGNGFWINLPLMEDAPELWNYIKDVNPQILSATGITETGADAQKRDWIANHFGRDVVVNLVKTATDKSIFAHPNAILIDDSIEAIRPWESMGGVGILHTTASDTIEKLKMLGA